MLDLFDADERLIFRYRDGGKEVCADPAVLFAGFRKAQAALGVDYDELARELDGATRPRPAPGADDPPPSPEEEAQLRVMEDELAQVRDDAFEKIGSLGRLTFGKGPLEPDGAGWTVAQGARALAAFLRWNTELAKKAGGSPSPSPSTDGPREGSDGGPSGA